MRGTGKKVTSAGGWDSTQDGGKQLLSPCNLYKSFAWKNACCCSDPACSTPQGPAQCWSTSTVKPLCCLLDTFGAYRLNSACTHPNTHSSNPTSLKPSIPQPIQHRHQQTTTPRGDWDSIPRSSQLLYQLKQPETYSRVTLPLILLSLAPVCSGCQKHQALGELTPS